jgi:hypothetical protein
VSVMNPDNDVHEVMDMILGDYLHVYREGLEDQMQEGDISPNEQMLRFIRFSAGCRKICEIFGLDADTLDVDKLLAAKHLCDAFKGVIDDGRKDSC